MIDFIAKNFYYLFLGLIIFNVIQRKYRGVGGNKRMASLIAAIMVFILYIGAQGIKAKNLPEYWIYLPIFIDITLFYALKNKLFIFKRNCVNCGKKLSSREMLYIDSNLCADCDHTEERLDKQIDEMKKGTESAEKNSGQENESESSPDSETE
jgi:hypothetical protein